MFIKLIEGRLIETKLFLENQQYTNTKNYFKDKFGHLKVLGLK